MASTDTPSSPGFFKKLKRWTIGTIVLAVALYFAYLFLIAPRRQGLAERGLWTQSIPIPPGHHLLGTAWHPSGRLWYAYCPNDDAGPRTDCILTELTPPGVLAGKFTFTQTR